ncbi:MAG TPA: hypothetical protein VKS79_06795 [Gemmataceae bacterium]|nr:hypothetical protein [Gemmataceae bacterium]
MAEKMQTPVLDRSEDPARYQPLSLLAVAAVLVSGVLALVIVVLTGAGLYCRKPILEPVLILLALGGAILALAARWHIANSEGTRAGTGLAKAALWISVIGGLCYGAYFGGNYFAIRNQANEVALKYWFEPLKDGKHEEAYYYTIDPAQRQNMTPRDVAARFGDNLQKFRQQELIGVLDRAKQEAQIEPRGMESWSKESVGYIVNLKYLVTTREGEFDVLLSLVGSDSKELQRREWFIQKSRELIQGRRLTTYGRLLIETQINADQFIREWLASKAASGREEERYLDTLPISPDQRRGRLSSDNLRMMISRSLLCAAQPSCGVAQAMVGAEFFGPEAVDQSLYFPNGQTLAKQIIIPEQTKDGLSEEFKTKIWPHLLDERVMSIPRSMAESDIPTTLEINADEIRVSVAVGFQFSMPSPFQYKGRLFVTTRDPALLKKVKELQSAPWPAPVVVDQSASVLAGLEPNWYVSEIRIDPTPVMDPRMQRMMGGAPGAGGGP